MKRTLKKIEPLPESFRKEGNIPDGSFFAKETVERQS